MLAGLGERETTVPAYVHSRADEGQPRTEQDRIRGAGRPAGGRARDIYIPDLHIDTLKQRTRDFR